jgi:hypothetical protein
VNPIDLDKHDFRVVVAPMSADALTSWFARHSNGWVTFAELRPDGTWAAWAVPDGDAPTSPDYIEMDDVSAKAAADYALREKSGHVRCDSECAPWELHTHRE